jgi:hypothetical protein
VRRCFLLTCTLGACSPGSDATEHAAASPVAQGADEKPVPANSDALELPPVDAVAASDLAAALPQVSVEQRGRLAARGLFEIEGSRLPAAFNDGLKAITEAPPDMRAVLLSRALADSLPMLDHLCGDGRSLMRSLAEMPPAGRGPALFDGCELGARGLVSREAMGGRDEMMVLMAHLAYDHLSRGGPLHPGERAAIEAMAASPIGR